MLVVADTGPLISLIQLGQLQLLIKLFPDFIIPIQVFEELKQYKPIQNFTPDLHALETHVRIPSEPFQIADELDFGERACMSLYYEMKADAILIEDRIARDWAENQGINCFGSIAVLIKAKRAGLLTELRPALLLMRANKRYISDELFYRILKDEGEQP